MFSELRLASPTLGKCQIVAGLPANGRVTVVIGVTQVQRAEMVLLRFQLRACPGRTA